MIDEVHETFTSDQIAHSLQMFLDWGENERGRSQLGYFSGNGFAARALRYHLTQLKQARVSVPTTTNELFDRHQIAASATDNHNISIVTDGLGNQHKFTGTPVGCGPQFDVATFQKAITDVHRERELADLESAATALVTKLFAFLKKR